MVWPTPEPGLVIRYSYLWADEARQGREEGVKDRPCAIVMAFREDSAGRRVLVVPITHSPPVQLSEALEIPPPTKARLGLDGSRSWIVISEYNVFRWPGPDLRPLPGKGPQSAAFGFLPRPLLSLMLARFVARVEEGKATRTIRTD